MPKMIGKPHYVGHRERLRGRLLENSLQLADYEALELALGYALPRRDTKPLAKELLSRFGSLREVVFAPQEELARVAGVGPGLIAYFRAWQEILARMSESPARLRPVLDSPEAVAEMAMARLGRQPREEFWLALVDNKNRLISWKQVSRGTVDQAPAYPREILALALEHKASGVILVHNHPGGDPRPSGQDVDLTRRLARTGQELGVRVLDHLIVAEADFYSFQAQGML